MNRYSSATSYDFPRWPEFSQAYHRSEMGTLQSIRVEKDKKPPEMMESRSKKDNAMDMVARGK